MNLRGKFTTDEDGCFWFRTVKMVGYPIPVDGVVGRMLKAQGRHPYRPAHLHALIFKPGFKTLISQVFDPSDPHIDSDVQFGVTAALTEISFAMMSPTPATKMLWDRGSRLITPTPWSRAKPFCRARRSNNSGAIYDHRGTTPGRC